MTSLDTSLSHTKQGSATLRRSSYKNPVEPLARLMETDSTASFGLLFRKWKKIVERDPDLLEAVLLYAFRNYHSAIDNEEAAPESRTRADIEKEKVDIAVLVESLRPHLVLAMKMPNGKKLGDCTFREVSQIGGLFKLLATKGKPSQKIREVFSDADLRAFVV